MNDISKLGTLAFVIKDQQVLLGMKKRKFGEGKWNGFGGKVVDRESSEQAMIRELQEESGVVAIKYKKKGALHFDNKSGGVWDVDVYVVTQWEGEPDETEEMRPQWFEITKLPFDQMWPDDRHWLPKVLNGESVEGEFILNDQGGLDSFELRPLDSV